jgi:hypothetical protein
VDKRKKKVMRGELMMLLAGVCLCLVIISTHFTSGLYARYSTGASGSDGARVIQFRQLTITETGSFTESGIGEKQFVFTPGVPLTKDIKISFGGSEAATIVFVAVKVTKWQATADGLDFTDSKGQLSWSVASGWTFLEHDGDLYVYYKELEPNTTMESVDFIKDGIIQVSSSGTTEIYASFPETLLSVKGYVVQANGFETVADAWNSVKE